MADESFNILVVEDDYASLSIVERGSLF